VVAWIDRAIGYSIGVPYWPDAFRCAAARRGVLELRQGQSCQLDTTIERFSDEYRCAAAARIRDHLRSNRLATPVLRVSACSQGPPPDAASR